MFLILKFDDRSIHYNIKANNTMIGSAERKFAMFQMG